MSVPAWMAPAAAEPVPAPTCPPPLSDAAWCARKRTFVVSVAHRLRQERVEAGDPADQALAKLLSFREALDHHPRHARNWWAKHWEDLQAMCAPFWPEQLGDPELEGPALLAEVRRVFPARTGDLSVSSRPASTAPASARETATQRGLGL